MRIVFMGSPEFAVPTLRCLIESEHEVVAAVCQPDRPAGRGRRVQPPAAKIVALAHGVPVLQPERVHTPEALAALRAYEPDALVIAAFGQILKQPLLDVPKRGVLNVHASLLPKHRGAAPIPAALLAGDGATGVTIMEVVLALDAGPIVAQRSIPIGPEDTTGLLTEKLAQLGADLLIEVLPAWARGEMAAQPQDNALATYAPPVKRQDAVIDWSLTATEIWRRVRADNPWPGATTTVDGEPLRILQAWPLDGDAGVPPATVVALRPEVQAPAGTGFGVRCGAGVLAVVRAQRAGRREMSGEELLRGWRDLLGKRLGG